jgi:hypothetical protein
MQEKKFELTYIGIMIRKNNKILLWMNMILALVSSSAIAGWAIWEGKLFIIWALMIAISQVISTIRPIIPIDKRNKVLYKYEFQLGKKYNEIERKWFDINNETITDKNVHNIICDFDAEWNELTYNHIQGEKFYNKKIAEEADLETNEYIIHRFGGDLDA